VFHEIGELLGGAPVVQCGALDDLSPDDVGRLRPGPGEPMLVTRMRDGAEVRVSERAVLPRLARCVQALEPDVDLFVVLCTGDLAGLTSRRPLVFPGPLLRQLAQGLSPGRLAVLTPAAEQVEPQRARWRAVARDVVVEPVSPYTEHRRLAEVGARVAEAGVELVVMDCIGYTRAMKADVRAAARCPVLLAATVLGRVVGEMVG
jgi:protein AroM